MGGWSGASRRGRGDPASGPTGTARDRALKLLGVRWRSREELRRRLRQAGFEPEDISQALDDLDRAGLVDDDRFARAVVRAQAGRRRSSDRVIRGALREKGVTADVAEAALAEAGGEEERAADLATRRAARMGGVEPSAAYRRLYGLLLRRGFGPSVAAHAARGALSPLAPSLAEDAEATSEGPA
jgi:regulatory protein